MKKIEAIIRKTKFEDVKDALLEVVIPIEDAVRIRTGERGDIALYNAEQEK